MPGTSPVIVRQLLPAVVLAAAGALVLMQLSQPIGTSATASLGDVPVNAEAIFTSTPRAVAEEPAHSAAPRVVHKPKPVASAAAPRKPETAAPVQQAAVGAPLSIAPPAEPAPVAASDTGIMGTLRSVQQMPQRAYSRVTGWFSSDAPPHADTPPRPPAEIPQNKAEM